MSVLHGFTSKHLELMPDFVGVRYEIIDGELHVSRAPGVYHQYTCAQVAYVLQIWDDQTGAGFVFVDPGLVFTEREEVIPDIVWVARDRFQPIIDRAGHFREGPDLVVEVLSPGRANEVRDRELKLDVYNRRGVKEYWIADWQQRVLEVYRRDVGELRLAARFSGDDIITSPLLPGFQAPVAKLWGPEM